MKEQKWILAGHQSRYQNIDIIINIEDDKENREQDIKTYSYFMKTLEIKGISEGIITKLYDNSYNTLYKILLGLFG